MTEIIESGPFEGLKKNAYNIIYADPPWRFETYSEEGKDRSAEKHYHCMSFEDICKLPVQDLAADDCTLLMWVTDPMLDKGLELMREWGFKFVTVGFYWGKTNKMNVGSLKKVKSLEELENWVSDQFFTGMGYWTRANPEICLLGTKGKPKRLSKSVRRLIVSQRREHSRKPDCTYERIIDLLGDLPRVELFCRSAPAGWDTFGNEIGKFEVGE